jgi:hypothetical protein
LLIAQPNLDELLQQTSHRSDRAGDLAVEIPDDHTRELSPMSRQDSDASRNRHWLIMSRRIVAALEVHDAVNTGTTQAIAYVTFPSVPMGVAARISDSDPGTCPGI